MDFITERFGRTQAWVDNNSQPRDTTLDDFEVITHPDAESTASSDLGVESFDESEEASSTTSATTQSTLSLESTLSFYHGAYSWPDSWPGTGGCFDCQVCGCLESHSWAVVPWPYCKSCKQFIDMGYTWSQYNWIPCHASFLAQDKRDSHYEAAGRIPQHKFKDLRSASKSKKRWRTNQEKYYHYKGVKPGQLNAEHYQATSERPWPGGFCGPLDESPTTVMTKSLMFMEAQMYPKPPTYHRRSRMKNRWPWSPRYERELFARKHADQQIGEELDEYLQGECGPLCGCLDG